MKANKIFNERQYNDAKVCENPLSVQNNKSNYVIFGTYRAIITFLYKNGTTDNIIVNDWGSYSYLELCARFNEYISLL